eukprot:431137-Rhodomonas_salina.1
MSASFQQIGPSTTGSTSRPTPLAEGHPPGQGTLRCCLPLGDHEESAGGGGGGQRAGRGGRVPRAIRHLWHAVSGNLMRVSSVPGRGKWAADSAEAAGSGAKNRHCRGLVPAKHACMRPREDFRR